MGQIVGGAAKPKRCNINQLSQLGTPAAGEHILVSSYNSMNAAGQGDFDCYIVGDERTAATALPLHKFKAEELDEQLNGKTITQASNAGTASSYWKNNNGVIGYSASGMGLHRADYISVKEGQPIELSTTLGSASVLAAIYCDDSSNVIDSIPKNTGDTRYSGVVPTGATRLYVNYMTTYTIQLTGEWSILTNKVDSLEQDISDVNDNLSGDIEALGQDVADMERSVNGITEADVTISGYNQYFGAFNLYAGTEYVVELSAPSLSGTYYCAVVDANNAVIISDKKISETTYTFSFTPSTDYAGAKLRFGSGTSLPVHVKFKDTTSIPAQIEALSGQITEVDTSLDSEIQGVRDENAYYLGKTIEAIGAGITSKQFDFPTEIGKKYLVSLPDKNDWSVDEVENTNVAVFVIVAVEDSTTTDLYRVTKGGFSNLGLFVEFMATTETSRLFLRADTGQKIVFSVCSADNYRSINELARKVESAEDSMVFAKAAQGLYAPFANGMLYHHLSVEFNDAYIPSQSLTDVRYAKALGFDFIEANAQRCSDGVYVVKHGNSGKLGAGLKLVGGGDCSDLLFADVTSTWLRENVVYNSGIDKYCTPIPTLEEFCAECSRDNIGIVLAAYANTDECLVIVRQYLPDSKIIAATPTSRGDFKGAISGWWSINSVDDAVAKVEQYGLPLMLGWSNYASADNALRKAVIKEMHKRGVLVSSAYLKPNEVVYAKSIGLDASGTTHGEVNPSSIGNVLNTNKLNDSALTFNSGAVYNSASDTITMAAGSSIVLPNTGHSSEFVKATIFLRYNGTLSIRPKNNNDVFTCLQDYASDGLEFISFAAAIDKNATALTLVASTAVTIYDWSIVLSVVF